MMPSIPISGANATTLSFIRLAGRAHETLAERTQRIVKATLQIHGEVPLWVH
jgi:hypothetical protein